MQPAIVIVTSARDLAYVLTQRRIKAHQIANKTKAQEAIAAQRFEMHENRQPRRSTHRTRAGIVQQHKKEMKELLALEKENFNEIVGESQDDVAQKQLKLDGIIEEVKEDVSVFDNENQFQIPK